MDKTKGEGAVYALWRGRAEPSAALSGRSGPFCGSDHHGPQCCAGAGGGHCRAAACRPDRPLPEPESHAGGSPGRDTGQHCLRARPGVCPRSRRPGQDRHGKLSCSPGSRRRPPRGCRCRAGKDLPARQRRKIYPLRRRQYQKQHPCPGGRSGGGNHKPFALCGRVEQP